MGEAQRYHIQQKVPENILTLTRMELIVRQMNIIEKWKPRSDVWPLRFGCGILGMAAGASGVYINNRVRVKLKLRSYGSLPTVLALFMTPAVTVYLLQSQFVRSKLLAYEVSCPFCLESKSILIQSFGALLLPLVGAPFANYAVGIETGKVNIPYQYDWRAISRAAWSIYQPLLPKLGILFTFQTLFAGFLAYSQIKSFIYMEEIQHFREQDKIEKRELKDALI